MDSSEFIEAVIVVVRNPTIRGTIDAVASPSGRRPDPNKKLRAAWWATLDQNDKEQVTSIVTDAVDGAMFGILCVLDGVSTIEDTPEKGNLELWFVRDKRVLLNPQSGEPLHDIYGGKIR